MQPKLSIELVPRTAFYSNVRSEVPKEKWDRIRRRCYQQANNRCQICSSIGTKQGFNYKVECHEIWLYDETSQMQKLKGFIALCPLCHTVKHFGLAQVRGKADMAMRHLGKVNNWTMEQVREYINECWTMWKWRNNIDWKLDVSYMDAYLDEPADITTYRNPDEEIW